MWTGLTYELYRDENFIARDVLVLNDGDWENPDVDHDTIVWSHSLRTLQNVHG